MPDNAGPTRPGYPILGYQSSLPSTLGVDKAIHSAQQQRLCELLRRTREDAGLRQVDVAEALDEPQSFVSKYESGERRLDLIELRQVCRVLGTPLIALVTTFEAVASGAH
jgi:ribosome-binding protein aMBF1 (putative translation factor)